MKAKAFSAALLATALSAPAGAVTVTFAGGSAPGTDPLGHSYTTQTSGPAAWGLPGLLQLTLLFNPANSTGSGTTTDANRFEFTLSSGTGLTIVDPSTNVGGGDSTTRFNACVPNCVAWTPVVSAVGDSVVFSAPTGTVIEPGDTFFVNVVFGGTVDSETFAWTASWSGPDAARVPAPAALALFGLSLAALTTVGRRRAA